MERRALRIGIASNRSSSDRELAFRVRSFLADDPESDFEIVSIADDTAATEESPDAHSTCDVILAALDDPTEIPAFDADGAPPLIAVVPDGDERTAVAFLHAGASEVIASDAFDLPRLERAALTSIERARLRSNIRDRQHELEAENALLRKQRREIEAFHHTLSHELKTPLTSIREFVSLIADEVAGPVNEEQREYLEICRRGCDQLKRVTNDLLDLSRIDTGKFSLRTAPTAIVPLVDRVVALESARAARLGVTLERAPLPESIEERSYAQADADRVLQILINLVDNALAHTEAGGTITLRIALDEADESPELVIAVADSGAGILPAEQPRVFERHYQGTRSDGSMSEGMGLGLSLCKELVELHGGRIGLESTPGRGSTFFFTLPMETSVPAPREVLSS